MYLVGHRFNDSYFMHGLLVTTMPESKTHRDQKNHLGKVLRPYWIFLREQAAPDEDYKRRKLAVEVLLREVFSHTLTIFGRFRCGTVLGAQHVAGDHRFLHIDRLTDLFLELEHAVAAGDEVEHPAVLAPEVAAGHVEDTGAEPPAVLAPPFAAENVEDTVEHRGVSIDGRLQYRKMSWQEGRAKVCSE